MHVMNKIYRNILAAISLLCVASLQGVEDLDFEALPQLELVLSELELDQYLNK